MRTQEVSGDQEPDEHADEADGTHRESELAAAGIHVSGSTFRGCRRCVDVGRDGVSAGTCLGVAVGFVMANTSYPEEQEHDKSQASERSRRHSLLAEDRDVTVGQHGTHGTDSSAPPLNATGDTNGPRPPRIQRLAR